MTGPEEEERGRASHTVSDSFRVVSLRGFTDGPRAESPRGRIPRVPLEPRKRLRQWPAVLFLGLFRQGIAMDVSL